MSNPFFEELEDKLRVTKSERGVLGFFLYAVLVVGPLVIYGYTTVHSFMLKEKRDSDPAVVADQLTTLADLQLGASISLLIYGIVDAAQIGLKGKGWMILLLIVSIGGLGAFSQMNLRAITASSTKDAADTALMWNGILSGGTLFVGATLTGITRTVVALF